jgi:hypothetical protein
MRNTSKQKRDSHRASLISRPRRPGDISSASQLHCTLMQPIVQCGAVISPLSPDPGQPARPRSSRSIAWIIAGLGLAMVPGLAAPALAADDTLQRSQDHLRQFPFAANCEGNTNEMVACLWRQRNQSDRRLLRLLGSAELLEPWRASRRKVCGQAAAKAQGGSVYPIVWLTCENALNLELLRQIDRPLLQAPKP